MIKEQIYGYNKYLSVFMDCFAADFTVVVLVPAMIVAIIAIRRRRRVQLDNDEHNCSKAENFDLQIAETSAPADNLKQRIDDDETPRTFAEILREHRTSRHISQEYVAEQLNVTRQAVSKWENGTSEPSTANLIALAKLYGISLDELVMGTKS